MKTVYNGAGTDNTAAVKSYLLATRNPIVHSLYQLGPSVIPQPTGSSPPAASAPWAFYWTDAEYPIHSTYLGQTYMPANFKRTSLTYKLGTEASTIALDFYTQDKQQPLNYTTSPRGMPPYQDAAMTMSNAGDAAGGWSMIYSMKQAITAGDLDGLAFTLWRVFEQTAGDADTLGVTNMFSGYVCGANASRSLATIQIASLMQTLQVQVPTQTIQPSDRGWQYTPRTNYDYSASIDATNSIPGTVWITGATIADHALADGWMIYVAANSMYRTTGTYPIYNSYYLRRIRDDVNFTNPFGSGAEIALYMYESLPWRPAAGDQAFLFAPSTPGAVKGFPYVPIPETVM